TAPAKNDYVLRTYEVSDLVVNIQDHPYSESLDGGPKGFGGSGGGGGGGGGGFFSVPGSDGRLGLTNPPPAAAAITMNDLTRVLLNTVASDTWAINGTGEGRIEPIGTALVVWQTPAIHEKIRELLNQIRQGSGDRKTVTIDARWLLLDSDDLNRLILPDQTGVPVVDHKLLDEFTRRPGSIRGITNCFSSQLVYLVSGIRRNFVSSYIPVVGSLDNAAIEQLSSGRRQSLIRLVSDTEAVSGVKEPRVGYQPIVEKPNLGALLELRPTLMRGDGTAVVDLKSTLTALGTQPTHIDGASELNSITPRVDRIAIETQEFATTLRMPLGKPVLVGGLTYVPGPVGPNDVDQIASANTDAKTTESPQLYFVLEVR
ncbi:MAG TPA: hypothetical protein VGM76_10660, partial [Lacipirellulaceae bacterium]